MAIYVRNEGAKPPSAKRLGPLQKSDHKSGRESLLCFFTSLPHFRDELAFGVIRRAGRWQQARQLAGGHGARSSYCATCLLCVRTSQPFHQRSKAGCDDESSASHFDDLDLAFADKHIERAAPDPKIARQASGTRMTIGSIAGLPRCFRRCSVVPAVGIPVDPFVCRVMTDRPGEQGRGQAGPPSTPSIDRTRRSAPHDVRTLSLPLLRCSAEV